MNTLTLKNYVQKVLFECEISGQLSDGKWENTYPYDHWKPWCDASVVVGENYGRNFYAPKCNYGLTSNDLLDCIGERMVQQANMAERGIPIELIREFNDYYPPLSNESGYNDKYWKEKREQCNEHFGSYEGLQHSWTGPYDLKKVKGELREIKKAMKTKI